MAIMKYFGGSKKGLFSCISHLKYFVSPKCKLVCLSKWIANGKRQNHAHNNFYDQQEWWYIDTWKYNFWRPFRKTQVAVWKLPLWDCYPGLNHSRDIKGHEKLYENLPPHMIPFSKSWGSVSWPNSFRAAGNPRPSLTTQKGLFILVFHYCFQNFENNLKWLTGASFCKIGTTHGPEMAYPRHQGLWGQHGADRTQVGHILDPWTLLSGTICVLPAN